MHAKAIGDIGDLTSDLTTRIAGCGVQTGMDTVLHGKEHSAFFVRGAMRRAGIFLHG